MRERRVQTRLKEKHELPRNVNHRRFREFCEDSVFAVNPLAFIGAVIFLGPKFVDRAPDGALVNLSLLNTSFFSPSIFFLFYSLAFIIFYPFSF